MISYRGANIYTNKVNGVYYAEFGWHGSTSTRHSGSKGVTQQTAERCAKKAIDAEVNAVAMVNKFFTMKLIQENPDE